jgi:hypothetical protein
MTARTAERQDFYDSIMVTFAEGGIQMIGQILHREDDETRWLSGLEGKCRPYKTLVVEYYGDEGKQYTVTVDTLSKAFTAMGAGEVEYLHPESRKRLLKAYREMEAGDIDAVDATNLVEIALYGRVEYA